MFAKAAGGDCAPANYSPAAIKHVYMSKNADVSNLSFKKNGGFLREMLTVWRKKGQLYLFYTLKHQ